MRPQTANAETPAAPRTLTDQAYAQLREDIIAGRLEPDEKLRIEALRREYALGATPLREALSRLSADGFVVASGQRGFRVAPVSVADLEDITELRVMLELRAVRESLEQGDEDWEARVVTAFYRLTKVEEAEDSDIEEWELRNHDFHEALMSGCESPWLQRFHATLYDQHKRYRNICLHTSSVPRNLHAEHQQLHDTALARDVEAHLTATEAHIRRTAEITRKVLAEAHQQ